MLCTATLLCAVVFLCANDTPAQTFEDGFTYPAGPLAGPWQLARGLWETSAGMAQAAPSTLRQYAVVSRLALQDCVVECVVHFNPTAANVGQRGGVVIRAQDPAQGQDLAVLEAVNLTPTHPSGFDAFMISEYTGNPNNPGGGVAWILRPHFLEARLRLTAIGTRLKAEIDVDQDGTFDRAFGTLSRAVPAQPGAVGLHGAASVRIDNFRLFDGVLIESLTAPPSRPGAVVPLQLRGFPGGYYQAAASLGTSGIAAGPVKIPLSLDPLFLASVRGDLGFVFRRFAGRLDATGDATLEVAIPLLPALVGTTIHVAFSSPTPGARS